MIQEAERKISLPPPLLVFEEGANSSLSSEEIIRQTNLKRAENGLPPLQESAKLNSSAQLKAQDMLKNQYFEHESPSGEQVADLAGEVKYEFIILGENLAMGGFRSEQALVQAWMDSPGHRENILNPQYREIGVSAINGEYNGKNVWMAVQHFARPLSSCPQADENLKASVEINEKKAERIKEQLETLKYNLNTKKDVQEYNDLVWQYNRLIEQNKALVSQYNQQVREFNACLEQ